VVPIGAGRLSPSPLSASLVARRKTVKGTHLHEWDLFDLRQHETGLFNGGGPMRELVEIGERGRIKLVFETRTEAETVARYIDFRAFQET
jgi:hypothetical protein